MCATLRPVTWPSLFTQRPVAKDLVERSAGNSRACALRHYPRHRHRCATRRRRGTVAQLAARPCGPHRHRQRACHGRILAGDLLQLLFSMWLDPDPAVDAALHRRQPEPHREQELKQIASQNAAMASPLTVTMRTTWSSSELRDSAATTPSWHTDDDGEGNGAKRKLECCRQTLHKVLGHRTLGEQTRCPCDRSQGRAHSARTARATADRGRHWWRSAATCSGLAHSPADHAAPDRRARCARLRTRSARGRTMSAASRSNPPRHHSEMSHGAASDHRTRFADEAALDRCQSLPAPPAAAVLSAQPRERPRTRPPSPCRPGSCPSPDA